MYYMYLFNSRSCVCESTGICVYVEDDVYLLKLFAASEDSRLLPEYDPSRNHRQVAAHALNLKLKVEQKEDLGGCKRGIPNQVVEV